MSAPTPRALCHVGGREPMFTFEDPDSPRFELPRIAPAATRAFGRPLSGVQFRDVPSLPADVCDRVDSRTLELRTGAPA
jgi:hypothetical protein